MLGGYPIGGPNATPPIDPNAPPFGQPQQQQPQAQPGLGPQGMPAPGGMGSSPPGGFQLPNYAGQANQAVQGMFASPQQPPAHHRDWGGMLANFVQNYAAGLGNPAAQATLAAQEQRRQAQQEAQRQQMAPVHIGDSLVQRGANGTYNTLWTKPDDGGDDKKTAIEKEVAYYRSIGRNDLAELRLQNFADPVHPDTIIDQSTGTPRMVMVDRNGPVSAQGSGSQPPPQAIQYLRAHPETAQDFDKWHGAGSSAKYLNQGGPGPSGPGTF